MTHRAFKSPLDGEIALHGNRYGFMVHFVKEGLKHDMVKHLPKESPFLHNWNHKTDELKFDEACIGCALAESVKHVNQKGWDGLEWKGPFKKFGKKK